VKTIVLCFLLCNSLSYAQQITWRSGSLVLDTDKVCVGELSVQDGYDLILFRIHDSVTVYPAYRIQSARCYDDAVNVNRKFISVKEDDVSHRAFHLYEVVLQGEWSILRKRKNTSVGFKILNDKEDYQYYLKSDDQLVSLMHFREIVYPQLLENSHNELLSFIAVNKLNPSEPASAIRIIDFYNKRNSVRLASLDY